MSDEEEESMSEGFSASEDEWKPTKDVRGGESSDDDDSDFEDNLLTGAGDTAASSANKKKEPKGRSATKAAAAKKRKPMGQSLRAKLYNKYRPPPKTFSPARGSSNSPSASTSRTASKNAKTPNESGELNDDDTSSDSSVENYLVNPAELDFKSSFFSVTKKKEASPAPNFDCNAGMGQLSDSGSEDNNESSAEEHANANAFDFRSLLENANSMERAKETIAKRAAELKADKEHKGRTDSVAAMDVNSLLALGEKQKHHAKVVNDDDDGEEEKTMTEDVAHGPLKLNKTKSTRVKRHTKTRPTSTVGAGDSDDSDFEEVADEDANETRLKNDDADLEIHVELPSNRRKEKTKAQQDLEVALRRKLNRDLKERQLLLHKASLLCCFARSYTYNRMLNDTTLMQAALKLLPSQNAYPPERGTELKYYEAFVTWYKTAIKLLSPNLYPEKVSRKREAVKAELLEQIKRKEARCKQDMIFMFIILVRGMGLQCRLVVNMQPLPLRPAQADLLTVKLKKDDAGEKGGKETKQVIATKEEKDKSLSKEVEHKEVVKKKDVKQPIVPEMKAEKSKPAAKIKEKSIEEQNTKQKSTKEKPNEMKDSKKDEALNKEKAMKTAKTESTKQKESPTAKKLEPKAQTVKEKRLNLLRLKNASQSGTDEETPIQNSQKGATLKRAPLKRAATVTQPDEGQQPKLTKQQSQATSTRSASKDSGKTISKVVDIREKPEFSVGSPVIPTVQLRAGKRVPHLTITASKSTANEANENPARGARATRSRSKSPKAHISPTFLQTQNYKEKFPEAATTAKDTQKQQAAAKAKLANAKVQISSDFLKQQAEPAARILRSRQKSNQTAAEPTKKTKLDIPQLDGADDVPSCSKAGVKPKPKKIKKLNNDSDDDFQPSPIKKVKKAPKLPAKNAKAKDYRVFSSDEDKQEKTAEKKKNSTAADMWVEVWSDAEEQWMCIDIFKGKINSVETIRRSASSNFAYVFAFQNDLTLKDITARYCPHWTTTIRKCRTEYIWLEAAIARYYGRRTKRDIKENQELRRIHEELPMPTAISDYKDHPLYALERHLLKFQAIYPPEPPTLGFVRGEPVYSRDCVHTLHSRELWLKQARTVRLGEKPYKIVKARPKWDRLTQTVIKDQPLEIFGYWQTQDYEPPTAENGIVPRNAYGNVELFKARMLPKKTVHLKLPGLNRICKKLSIDCANAVIGFDFHQGLCHPAYDGFVVCEEFEEIVTAAWHEDQVEQVRKDQEKYETRVYGNWKKLIRGLLIRERLKKKYNF